MYHLHTYRGRAADGAYPKSYSNEVNVMFWPQNSVAIKFTM